MSMSVTNSQRVHHHKTNSQRPVHAYRKLPEFAIKLQKQKLFKRVIIIAGDFCVCSVWWRQHWTLLAPSTGALDGIVELKRNKTDLTAGCLLSM